MAGRLSISKVSVMRSSSYAFIAALLAAACTTGSEEDEEPAAPVTCPTGEPTLFTDVSLESGIAIPGQGFSWPGVAIVDIDGDAMLDVLVGAGDAGLGVYLGRGDLTFEDRSAPDITGVLGFATSDVDGDGRSEVAVFGDRIAGWLVEGEAGYEIRPLSDDTEPAVFFAAAFGDASGDGVPDLYAAAYAPAEGAESARNHLWIGTRGPGTSAEEVAVQRGVSLDDAWTLAVAWTDLDENGLPEIIAAQDFAPMTGMSNAVFHGDPGGGYVDVAPEFGLDHSMFSMDVALFDADGDGGLDIYVTNIGANVLAMRRGDQFVDEARPRGAAIASVCGTERVDDWPDLDSNSPDPSEAGLAQYYARFVDRESDCPQATSWSAVAFDFDHDGDEDLFVSNGAVMDPRLREASVQPDVLLMNLGDGTFVDSSVCSGLNFPGDGRGAAAGDMDGDGDLDLVVADANYLSVAAVRVYRNDAPEGRWLKVRLRGTSSTPDGLGARVRVRAGGREQLREISGRAGFASAAPPMAHFGLGDAQVIDTIEVEWPSGIVDRLTDEPTNRLLSIIEGSTVSEPRAAPSLERW